MRNQRQRRGESVAVMEESDFPGGVLMAALAAGPQFVCCCMLGVLVASAH